MKRRSAQAGDSKQVKIRFALRNGMSADLRDAIARVPALKASLNST
jgi:hypothetical protein